MSRADRPIGTWLLLLPCWWGVGLAMMAGSPSGRDLWIVLACVGFYVVAFGGLLLAPMKWPLLWVALLGMGPSTFPLALTMINLRTRSAGGSAALSGFMQGVGYTLSCAGPFMFGWLHSLTHGWAWPFAFLGLCLLTLLVGGYLVSKPRMLEDTW